VTALLVRLFQGGPPLPPPGAPCGRDSTPDALGCGAAECPAASQVKTGFAHD
jgi:hypothetical protein